MLTLELKTAIFPTEPEGDLEYSNGHPGSAFCLWLKERLADQGIESDEPIQEDYGWGFWLQRSGEPIWICVSYAEEQTWFLSCNHEIPFLFLKPWQWGRKKVGKVEEKTLFDLLKSALESNSEIAILGESEKS